MISWERQSEGFFEHGYGVFIGVGDDLPWSAHDAEDLASVFRDKNRAAYRGEHVHECIGVGMKDSTPKKKGAKKKEIIEAFETVIRQLRSISLDDRKKTTMIVYFSGHGKMFSLKRGGEEYRLILNGFDWSKQLNRRYVRANTFLGSEFATWIQKIKTQGQCERLVVILDACHAGEMASKGGPMPIDVLPPEFLQKLEGGTGSIIIASCSPGQDSVAFHGDRNSVFTQALLDTLQRDPRHDESSAVWMVALLSEVMGAVRNRMREKQTPRIPLLRNFEDFILSHRRGSPHFQLHEAIFPKVLELDLWEQIIRFKVESRYRMEPTSTIFVARAMDDGEKLTQLFFLRRLKKELETENNRVLETKYSWDYLVKGRGKTIHAFQRFVAQRICGDPTASLDTIATSLLTKLQRTHVILEIVNLSSLEWAKQLLQSFWKEMIGVLQEKIRVLGVPLPNRVFLIIWGSKDIFTAPDDPHSAFSALSEFSDLSDSLSPITIDLTPPLSRKEIETWIGGHQSSICEIYGWEVMDPSWQEEVIGIGMQSPDGGITEALLAIFGASSFTSERFMDVSRITIEEFERWLEF